MARATRTPSEAATRAHRARTGPADIDGPMPGQTEIELRPMQPTLWSL